MFSWSMLSIDYHVARERFSARLSEWQCAFTTLAVGMVLANSETFDLAPYAITRSIVSQGAVAGFLIGLAVVRLGVLFINGAMPRYSPHLRSALASVSSLTWSILFATLLAFETMLMVGGFMIGVITFEVANAFRAAQDAQREDCEHARARQNDSRGAG